MAEYILYHADVGDWSKIQTNIYKQLCTIAWFFPDCFLLLLNFSWYVEVIPIRQRKRVRIKNRWELYVVEIQFQLIAYDQMI